MLSANDGKSRHSRPARSYNKNTDIQSSNQLICVNNKQVQYISVCKEQCCRTAAVYINVYLQISSITTTSEALNLSPDAWTSFHQACCTRWVSRTKRDFSSCEGL